MIPDSFSGSWLIHVAKLGIVLGVVLIFIMLFRACETERPQRVKIGDSMDIGDSYHLGKN
jgi:hypothetical protein